MDHVWNRMRLFHERAIARSSCSMRRFRHVVHHRESRLIMVSSQRRELRIMHVAAYICYYTITIASSPQNRKGYWSIIVWTTSSRYGLIASNLPRSLNSIGSKVGHQHIARFLLSILLSLQFSATLKSHKFEIYQQYMSTTNVMFINH